MVCSLSVVDTEEIKRLGKRFRKLDLDNSGALSVDEFMSLPELQQNPLVKRVIEIFDVDGNGEVDFKGTVIQSIGKIMGHCAVLITSRHPRRFCPVWLCFITCLVPSMHVVLLPTSFSLPFFVF